MKKAKIKARGMILAAGFGSRLGVLGQSRPKPMLPVCGAPLVQWVLQSMARQGIEEFVINLHHLGEQIEAHLGDGSRFGVKIHYSYEEPIQGTGGGIRDARQWLDPGDGLPIVVANGKLIQDIDIQALLRQQAQRQSEAVMVLRRDLEGIWGAALAYDPQEQRLTEFLGERSPHRKPEDLAVMFCGVHVVTPAFLDRIPATGTPCIARSAYAEAFAQQGGIDALLHEGYWWEHSTQERYREGVSRVFAGQIDEQWAPGPIAFVHPSAEIDAQAQVDPRCWIGPDVRVAKGAVVGPGCMLLAGAQVAADAQLQGCIVLEGASARGEHQDSIIAKS